MSKEPTRLHITYSSPISDRELRKMVQAVEDTNVSIETRLGVKEMVFVNMNHSYMPFDGISDLFDILELMAKRWAARGKIGRWVDCVRSP